MKNFLSMTTKTKSQNDGTKQQRYSDNYLNVEWLVLASRLMWPNEQSEGNCATTTKSVTEMRFADNCLTICGGYLPQHKYLHKSSLDVRSIFDGAISVHFERYLLDTLTNRVSTRYKPYLSAWSDLDKLYHRTA